MHILGTTVSLHCGLFRYSVTYIHILSLHRGHVQLCDMSVMKPLVTPIYNGTALSTWYFLQNGYICVLKDIVDVKLLFDKMVSSYIRRGKHHIIPVLSKPTENSI